MFVSFFPSTNNEMKDTNMKSLLFEVDDGIIPGTSPEGDDAGCDDEEGCPVVNFTNILRAFLPILFGQKNYKAKL